MALRFRGGVHPPEAKTTSNAAIVEFGIPEQVIVPLQQHIGAPAAATVAVGDVVKKGQLIGEPGGFVSAAVHASIGGTVKKIEPFPSALGMKVESIFIEGNGDDAWAEGCSVERDVSSLDGPAIVDAIQKGGLVGMGGATFPTHVKLSPPPGKTIDTLILNGAECEPCLTADERVMLEMPAQVINGALLMLKALGCETCIIGIEDNKPEAVKTMTAAAAEHSNITVTALHVRYPQGAEKQLIYSLVGCEVPSGGLPMDIGVVVQNVGTSVAVDDAVRRSLPLIERVVTVTGDKAKATGNFRARVGTLISEIIEHVGIKESMNRLISGGPMMGLALPSADIPFTKGTSGIILTDDSYTKPNRACIRCGKCVDVCPMGLTPSKLSTMLENHLVEEADQWNMADCMECGGCAYICPSGRPIVQQVKFGKVELRRLKSKK